MIEILKNKIKELESENISISDLSIINEIDAQLENTLPNNEYEKLFRTVKGCHFKVDIVSLCDLVNFCIKNIDKIDNMSTYEIIENSYISF